MEIESSQEKRLRSLLQNAGVGGFHTNLPTLQSAIKGQYLPVIKRSPHIVIAELHRLRVYITEGQANPEFILDILSTLAKEVPELRDPIAQTFGALLYGLVPDVPEHSVASSLLRQTLGLIGMAPDGKEAALRTVIRGVVSLRHPLVVVIGAGFSYEAMPITPEVVRLLVPLLVRAGVRNPVALMTEDTRTAWEIAKKMQDEFKMMFAGWSGKAQPGVQHNLVAELLEQGRITHLISFNWDDLIERAYFGLFQRPIPKVTEDGQQPVVPSLWKLHGDVERPDQEWVFPYDLGRVFESLIGSLQRTFRETSLSGTLIVGYSESEPEVQTRLIEILERNAGPVLRVRPNWPLEDQRGIPLTARQFSHRFRAHLEMER